MQAYRIVNWVKKFETTKKGKSAEENERLENMKKYRLSYLRLENEGHNLTPTWRMIMELGWKPNEINEFAVWGVYVKLLFIAGDFNSQYRGWILDERKQPMAAKDIAKALGTHEIGRIQEALDILCRPEVGLLELVEYNLGEAPHKTGEAPHKTGELLFDARGVPQTSQTPQNEGKPSSTQAETPHKTGESPIDPSGNLQEQDKEFKLKFNKSSPPEEGKLPAPEKVQGDLPDKRRQTYDMLCEILKIQPESLKALISILDCIEIKVLTGGATEGLYDLVVGEAKQCTEAENPMGLFVNKMKKQPFGYQPKKLMPTMPTYCDAARRGSL